MNSRGVRVQGGRLRPPEEAKTLRIRHGEWRVADGPFAEAQEQIIGYSILDCADLTEAMTVAGKHPVAQIGAIELRAFST